MNEVVPTPEAIEGARNAVQGDVILDSDGRDSTRPLQLAIMLVGWTFTQLVLLLVVVTESDDVSTVLPPFTLALASLSASVAYISYTTFNRRRLSG